MRRQWRNSLSKFNCIFNQRCRHLTAIVTLTKTVFFLLEMKSVTVVLRCFVFTTDFNWNGNTILFFTVSSDKNQITISFRGTTVLHPPLSFLSWHMEACVDSSNSYCVYTATRSNRATMSVKKQFRIFSFDVNIDSQRNSFWKKIHSKNVTNIRNYAIVFTSGFSKNG